MQDQYVGDIGDFGKYALLKTLCLSKPPFFRLGVVWYLVPNEEGRNDGRFTQYLEPVSKNERLRVCDPELWDQLRKVVKVDKDRRVEKIETDGILSTNTKFFSEHVPKGLDQDGWLKRARDCVESCEVVFLDPDNGLEIKSCRKTDPKGSKYVFRDELVKLWDEGNRSVILYQHLTRMCEANELVKECAGKIRQWLDVPRGEMFGLRWQRFSGRWFIVIPASKKHRAILLACAKHMVESTNWGRLGHFTGLWEL